jgi:hypothetical protein
MRIGISGKIARGHNFLALNTSFVNPSQWLIAVFSGFMRLAQESNNFSVVLCALCASAV